MSKFNVGDKVYFVRGGKFAWETINQFHQSIIKPHTVYTIDYITDDRLGIRLAGNSYIYHFSHFELVENVKTYVVKLNQDEVDALINGAGAIHGSEYKSMRLFTDDIWNYLFEDLGINSVNPYEIKTSGVFTFWDIF
jgi:hypothetical protein